MTSSRNGIVLLAIRECVNGTGGCQQSFFRERGDRWQPLRLIFLDSLTRRYPYSIRHGFDVDPQSLDARVGLYSDKDPNCCPSHEAVMQLRVVGDSLTIKTVRVVPLE